MFGLNLRLSSYTFIGDDVISIQGLCKEDR